MKTSQNRRSTRRSRPDRLSSCPNVSPAAAASRRPQSQRGDAGAAAGRGAADAGTAAAPEGSARSSQPVPSSSSTGSPSRVRRNEPPSPIALEEAQVLGEAAERDVLAVVGRRLRDRRRARAASGPRRRASVAPRAASPPCPASTSSSAAASPASPPPTTATFTGSSPRATTASLRASRAASSAEDVEAVRLDPVERLAVQAGEGADAERAAPVERLEQPQPLGEMRPRPLGLERHQLPELRRRRRAPSTPNGVELVLREIDAAERSVLVDVADDVDQLERDPQASRMLGVVGAVDGHAREPDGAGDLLAVAAQLGEVGVASTARDPAARRRSAPRAARAECRSARARRQRDEDRIRGAASSAARSSSSAARFSSGGSSPSATSSTRRANA